jgi:RNA polymerase sigma-70 factor (ECF subfamily)
MTKPEEHPLAPDHQEQVHTLFLRHSPEIRGYIIALLPDFSRVDDIFQETFLTVSRKARDFKINTNFLAWCCSIARFKVLEAARQQPHGVQPLSAEVLDALCASEPEPEPEEHQLRALAQCVQKLPSHTRRAFELRYQQAHNPPEIARRLGWSVASVYVVLSRARADLRTCVDRFLANESEASHETR